MITIAGHRDGQEGKTNSDKQVEEETDGEDQEQIAFGAELSARLS